MRDGILFHGAIGGFRPDGAVPARAGGLRRGYAPALQPQQSHRPGDRSGAAGGDPGHLRPEGHLPVHRRVLPGPDPGGRGAESGAAAAGRRADALIEGLYQELRHGGAAAGLLPVRRPGAADPDGPRHPGLERIHSRPDGGDRRPGAAGIFGPGPGDHPHPAAASGGGAGGAGADGDPLPHQFSAVFLPPGAGGAAAGAGAANPGLRQLSRPGAGLVSHGGKAAGAEPAAAGRNKGDPQWRRTS